MVIKQQVTQINLSLQSAEASFIVTGVEGTQSISDNKRNAENIGSIFKSEVDSSDNKTVTIHIYEMVRNSKDDEHKATADWLIVDRSTGIVSSRIFESRRYNKTKVPRLP